MMKTYKQLTYEQRCQIFVLKKIGNTQQEIADAVGVSQSAISREFNRNTGRRGYRYKQAQNLCESRRLDGIKTIKMTQVMIDLIKSKLQIKWSPEQISRWLREEKGVRINHETIYQHIQADKKSGGTLYNFLRGKGKAYQHRSKSQAGRGHIKNRVSID